MRKIIYFLFFVYIIYALSGCNEVTNKVINRDPDSSFVNTKHLDHLYTPITFHDGTKAAGIYIYSEYPDYHLVADNDEGFTCVDDVSRAALVYLRSKNFKTDTALQAKVFDLLHFILEMQSGNGYFYNFLFPDNTINKNGKTSVNEGNWWSWRTLQTLTEAAPAIKSINPKLYDRIDSSIKKLVGKIKSDIINITRTTKKVNGITVPQWLPAGSATDQSAIIILGLIQYNQVNNDTVITSYIKKLADGIVMMQKGDSVNFPYSCFLSWENVWHAYGNDQAYALFKAAEFFKDTIYSQKAFAEVDNFYPWLLKNGLRSSFYINKTANKFQPVNEKKYAQIAYGIRPMVFAAAEAYRLTEDLKYADMAANLAAWLLGSNEAKIKMYDKLSGRCYDGIVAKDSVNHNSGAESTIEALLTLQRVENFPLINSALNKYNSSLYK
ncbi:MAG TPA: hypothetical protein VGP43_08560 [Chitinophagaceae bacterium]|nr:hypothetical protein [Chitinophagaceae bacterium]